MDVSLHQVTEIRTVVHTIGDTIIREICVVTANGDKLELSLFANNEGAFID